MGLISFKALLVPALMNVGHNFDELQAHEEHSLYVALPVLIALLIVGSRSLVLKLEFAAKALWYIAISLILVIEILISGSWSYALGQPAEMWRWQTEQWPESWRAKVALLDSTIEGEIPDSELQPALRSLEDIIALNPELYEQRSTLARVYVRTGQRNNALREYRILVRDPRATDVLIEEAANFMEGSAWEVKLKYP